MSKFEEPTEREIAFYKEDAAFVFSEEPVQMNQDLSNVVIINNLPVTPAEKEKALSTLIKRILEKKGGNPEILNYNMPIENGSTMGFCFVELKDKNAITTVIQNVNGFAIDAKHTLQVMKLEELEKYEKTEAKEFNIPEYKESENLRTWLLDPAARDQYVIRHYDTVEIYWNDPIAKQVQVIEKVKWSEDRVNWSPLGNYLVTWHTRGIALWGGNSWKVHNRFAHANPRIIDFSPNERYLVVANEDTENNVAIFDVKTAKKEKAFTIPLDALKHQWPLFKWSFNEKYFATLIQGSSQINVYDTATFSLFNGQPIKIPEVQDFSWSPTTNRMVYWTADRANVPAKVSVVEFPRMNELRFKPFYYVKNISFLWHESGNFLAVQVDRFKTKKKGAPANAPLDGTSGEIITNIEIFRMNIADIPVESIEITDKIEHFAWEPKGDQFSIIHGDEKLKRNVTIYSLKQREIKMIKDIVGKQVDRVLWATRGRFFVLLNTAAVAGSIEFWDNTQLNDMIASGEHFSMNDATWDPTGRYFSTSCCAAFGSSKSANNGFIIWSCVGKILFQRNVDRLFQFIWRPRPPSLLTHKQELEILKDLPNKKQQYVDEEKRAVQDAHSEKLRRRQELWHMYMEFMDRLKKDSARDEEEREKLFGRRLVPQESDYYFETRTVEKVISSTKENIE